ncbi:prepilin-type N-terminal cleavage/methylation domain-containing protein [Opitutaceae bacterium TAV1]|nr:prepilin-type N-terminal cleavage/methylation domain-containing protein [Opitutaceae bacterium TAV1]
MNTSSRRLRAASRPLRPAAAFTLIELLTVIAIIGILAAIIIPVVGKVRESARRAQCVSNLRQIANAVLLFADDHRGVLPGGIPDRWNHKGLAGGQVASVNINNWNMLGTHIASYLNVKLPEDATSVLMPAFVCPSFISKYSDLAAEPGSVIYALNTASLLDGVVDSLPFGKQNKTFALRIEQIPNLSRTYMLRDSDKKADTSWNCPPEPVHGNLRNRVYFDTHVAPAKIVN